MHQHRRSILSLSLLFPLLSKHHTNERMLATHRPTYTEQEFEYVEWYNERVQYFYYAATFGFVAVLAASNATSRIIDSRLVARRRRLSFETTRPKEEKEEEARGTTRRSVSRALEATVATYRKWTYRRSRLLDLLGIANAAQGVSSQENTLVIFFTFGSLS